MSTEYPFTIEHAGAEEASAQTVGQTVQAILREHGHRRSQYSVTLVSTEPGVESAYLVTVGV